MSPFRPTAYPSTSCLRPSSPAVWFPRPPPRGLQTLGFERHQVSVTVTQLCHCSVKAHMTTSMSLCSNTALFMKPGSGPDWACQLWFANQCFSHWGDWGRCSKERGEEVSAACSISPLGSQRAASCSFLSWVWRPAPPLDLRP